MTSALLIEGIAYAAQVPREDVTKFLEEAEKYLLKNRGELSRNLASLSQRSESDRGLARSIVEYSRAAAGPQINRLALTLVGSLSVGAWGVSLVAAGTKVGATVVALGLGLEVSAVVAVLVGLVVIYVSGQYLWGAIKELLALLSSAVSESNNF